MFDWKTYNTNAWSTATLWHDGHTELFKRALAETGQAIMVRDVGGIIGEDAGGGRTLVQNDNLLILQKL